MPNEEPKKRKIDPPSNLVAGPDRFTHEGFFGDPQLLDGELLHEYEDLWEKVRGAVGCKDILDELWARDIADLLWESIRFRRVKASFLRQMQHEGLAEVLQGRVPGVTGLVRDWRLSTPEALQEVQKVLDLSGLSPADVTAQTFILHLDTLEKLDRLVAQADARRNSAWREVERRRDAVARRLQLVASSEIQDAEFTEVETAGGLGAK